MRAHNLNVLLLATLVSLGEARAGIIQQVSADRDRMADGESVRISFRLALHATVTITILDGDRAAVRMISPGTLGAGRHSVSWDGRDSAGNLPPGGAYSWRIEARASDGQGSIWEPAHLRSRPAEALRSASWNAEKKAVLLEVPAPMRGWVRVGLRAGACMRTLAEGDLWRRGTIEIPWDARDESGLVTISDRPDWFITAFGYRLPSPCVIVSGPEAAVCARASLSPPVSADDTSWKRIRGFCALDRLRLTAAIQRDGPRAISVALDVPPSLTAHKDAILDRVLGPGLLVRWFVDGRPVSMAAMSSTSASVVLPVDDGANHLITANIETVANQVYVASTWTETKE